MRSRISQVDYRAQDIEVRDIIQVDVKHWPGHGPTKQWAQVTDIIETGAEANRIANDNREKYRGGEHLNTGLFNFIARSGVQEKMLSGLYLLIRVDVTGHYEDDDNWHILRKLDLVTTQATA